MRTNFGDYRAKMDKDEKKFKLGKSEIGSIFIDLVQHIFPEFRGITTFVEVQYNCFK